MSNPPTGGPLDWLKGLGRSTPGPVAADPSLPSAGPKVAPSGTGENRYTIVVPSDSTTLSLGRAGGGGDSGITGETSRHVHFATNAAEVDGGTPTSLSLGAPRSGGMSTTGFTVETEGEMNMIAQKDCMLSSGLQCRIISDNKGVQIDAKEGFDARSDTAESVVYTKSISRTDNNAVSVEMDMSGTLKLKAAASIVLEVGNTTINMSPGWISFNNGCGAWLALIGDAVFITGTSIDAVTTQSITLRGGNFVKGHAGKIEWNP